MEACAKVVRHDEEVIGPFGSVPVRPVGGNKLNDAPHYTRRLERQREAVFGEVAGGVYGRVEPIRFFGIGSTDSAG